VEVRYGESQGSFRTGFSISTDLPTSPRTLAKVDEGPELDVLSPSPEGLDVFFGDPARILIPAGFAPHSEASLVVESADDSRLVPISTGGATDTLLGVAIQAGQLWLRRAPDANRPGSDAVAVAAAESQRLADRIVPGPVDSTGRVGAAVAVVGARQVHVVGFDQSREPQLLSSLSLGVAAQVAEGGARLLDLDRDRVGDLSVEVTLPGDATGVMFAKGRGDGTFEAPRLSVALERRCQDDAACARWPLAVGDLDADGSVDMAFSDGLYTLTASAAAPTQLYRQRIDPWGAATFLDLNGDGRLDVAAASATRGVLQLLINADEGRFNPVPVDVGRPIRALRCGDFDGDGLGDVALLQDIADDESEISVVFGTRGGPAQGPQLMGRFEHITDLEPGLLPSRALQNADGITDLVVRVDNGARRSYALMTGTGQRRLHAPLALPIGDDIATDLGSVPAAALGVDLRGVGEADIAVVTFGGRLILLPKTPGGTLVEATSILRVNPACATEAVLGNGCLQAAASRRPSGRDAVVVLNRRPDCPADVPRPDLALTRMELGADEMLSCTAYYLDGLSSLDTPATPHVRDLDANKSMDLLLAFTGREAGGAGVAIWRDESARPQVVRPDEGTLILAATDVGADRDPARELAILTPDGVHILDQEDGTYAWSNSVALPLDLPIDADAHIATADVDGDGLDDLLVSANGRLSVYLAEETWLGGDPVE